MQLCISNFNNKNKKTTKTTSSHCARGSGQGSQDFYLDIITKWNIGHYPIIISIKIRVNLPNTIKSINKITRHTLAEVDAFTGKK